MSPSRRPSLDSDSDISTAFARSDSLDKRVKDAADAVAAAAIKPQWIKHRRGAFWYRRRRRSGGLDGRKYEFVIVDTEARAREHVSGGDGRSGSEMKGGDDADAVVVEPRLAFDHEALGKALGRARKEKSEEGPEGRNDATDEGDAIAEDEESQNGGGRSGFGSWDADLPFRWIDVSRDSSSEDAKEVIKFRIGQQKWQFRCDDSDGNSLVEYEDEINEETLQPMHQEQPSDPSSHEKTTITFVNRTKQAVDLFWVDWDGQSKRYATVDPQSSNERPTYTGHVWRAVNRDTGEVIASFCAREGESTAFIEGNMKPAKPIDKSTKKNDLQHGDDKNEDAQTRKKDEKLEKQSRDLFVRDYDVWARDVDGQERRITSYGTEENPFDEWTSYTSYLPDVRFVNVSQYTPEQERKAAIVESSPKDQIQPILKQFQYLKPGDKVRIDRPRLFDLVEKKEISTDNSLFQNPFDIHGIGWSKDGNECWFYYNERGHQTLRVIGMNTQGRVRVIIEETTEKFIDYDSKLYFHKITETDELIWASERDGWNHLYLYELRAGKMKNRITTGEWVVRSVDHIDEKKRQIWIRAFGVVKNQDPYYAHLVRVNLDGSGFTVLTKGDGTHTWTWSPEKDYFLDTWSRVDLVPQNVLREEETGKAITRLEGDSLEKLLEVSWTVPERFASPGRDSKTMIYGIIIRPSNFDATRSYPVIEQIYAGPQDFSVPKSFAPLIRQHELAELGFIVVQIDGMGTNWRSKSFLDVCYKNLKDAGLPDRIAWMKAAAQTRPWMDLSRVGIYGGSAGGQNAMAALLWHGDFYKAAAADCGCHDNRVDKLWWNELFMGWPVDNKVYEDSSNVVHAGKLKGKLMLIVGELDENVDPASTMQVVNALNKAGKDYDLLFMPGKGHGVGTSDEYARRRQKDFFVRHLLGVEPPDRNNC